YLSTATTIRASQWKDSLTLYTDLLDKTPDHYYGYQSVGLALYDLKRYEEAIEYFDESLEIMENFNSYHGRALCKRYLGDYQGALEDYNSTMRMYPNFSECLYNRANLKLLMEDTTGSINDLTLAIKFNDTYARLYNKRADVYYQSDQKDLACKDWQKTVDLGMLSAKEKLESYCK
ncbi:MAG: hypothetical protein C0594_16600, partial [Marinilabiliales bacterium]